MQKFMVAKNANRPNLENLLFLKEVFSGFTASNMNIEIVCDVAQVMVCMSGVVAFLVNLFSYCASKRKLYPLLTAMNI